MIRDSHVRFLLSINILGGQKVTLENGLFFTIFHLFYYLVDNSLI